MTLSVGSSGKDVLVIQQYLRDLGFYRASIDAKFGPATFAAVIAFQRQYMVDGIVDSHTFISLHKAIDARKELPDKLWNPPRGLAEINIEFGVIECKDLPDGRVEITNKWEDENLVVTDFPIVGRQMTHKKIVESLTSVLQNITDRGLDQLIRQFWCFTPRHKMHNPKRSLSTHSWGIAVDINWSTNGVGIVGDMHPEIVTAFEQRGWEWGGRWRHRDDMHFQFCSGY